jgi:hypothetical protein
MFENKIILLKSRVKRASNKWALSGEANDLKPHIWQLQGSWLRKIERFLYVAH